MLLKGIRLQVIQALKDCKADIIALQEIDIGCKRSGELDTGEPLGFSTPRWIPDGEQVDVFLATYLC